MNNPPKIIADTCIWIDFFRTKSATSNRMKELLADNLIAGAGIILAELLQGAKANREREIVTDIFQAIDYFEITKDIWTEAGKLAAELRSQGKTIPLSDIILACCAQKYNCDIFTIDKHFQDIPGVKLI